MKSLHYKRQTIPHTNHTSRWRTTGKKSTGRQKSDVWGNKI